MTFLMGCAERMEGFPFDLIRYARWRAERINGHCRPKSVIPRNRAKSPSIKNHILALTPEKPNSPKITPMPLSVYLTTVLYCIHTSSLAFRTARCIPGVSPRSHRHAASNSFETAIAATVPSETAVVICRNGLLAESAAANPISDPSFFPRSIVLAGNQVFAPSVHRSGFLHS